MAGMEHQADNIFLIEVAKDLMVYARWVIYKIIHTPPVFLWERTYRLCICRERVGSRAGIRYEARTGNRLHSGDTPVGCNNVRDVFAVEQFVFREHRTIRVRVHAAYQSLSFFHQVLIDCLK